LLLFSGFGAFGLIASFFMEAKRKKILSGFLVFSHLVAAPLLLPLRVLSTPYIFGRLVDRAEQSVPKDFPDGTGTTVVVNAPDALTPSFAAAKRMFLRSRPVARDLRLLAVATDGRLILERTGEKTLEVTVTAGFPHEPFSRIFRGPEGFADHEKIVAGALTVEVLERTDDKRAKRARFTFDMPLEDPSFLWLVWEGKAFVRYTPPAVGQKDDRPPVDFGTAAF
jgi:hypothetical protein